MQDRTSDGRPVQGPEVLTHLLAEPSATCWWCNDRPATTGEHKFKRTDLTRLMSDGNSLIWGSSDGAAREIRGKSGVTRDRYGVVKFSKSLCDVCNNARSQPFDNAYDVYSEFVRSNWLRILPGVNSQLVFGKDWEASTLSLPRYYAKHFGCRMVRVGVSVPTSLIEFLDGAPDMLDGHMSFITTDTFLGTQG